MRRQVVPTTAGTRTGFTPEILAERAPGTAPSRGGADPHRSGRVRHGPPSTLCAMTTNTRPLAVAATLGTLPYVILKAFWLTGHPVGVDDPGLLESTSMVALNAATVVMDLAVVALAFTLASAWGRRLPAVAVLLPAWVATGLLVPISLIGLPAAVVAAAAGSGDAMGLAAWVRPMVYGGFAWQAVFLLAAFAVHARERWSGAVRRPAPADGPVATLMRACVGGGVATAVLGAALAVLGGVLAGGWLGGVAALTTAVFPLAGAAGVLALARGRTVGRVRTVAVVAAWCGSGAAFAGGLWTAVTTLGTTDLSAAGNPATGLGQLCCLLAGFALAVAGLLAVSGAASPVPTPSAGRGALLDA